MTENPAAVAWDEAYSATDDLLISVEGLIHAADMLAGEHEGFNNPAPASTALISVLRCLTEKNSTMRELRSVEYRAGRGLVRGELGSVSEGGK